MHLAGPPSWHPWASYFVVLSFQKCKEKLVPDHGLMEELEGLNMKGEGSDIIVWFITNTLTWVTFIFSDWFSGKLLE